MAGFTPLRKDTKMQVTKLQAAYRSLAEHLEIARLYFGFLRNGSAIGTRFARPSGVRKTDNAVTPGR
jgi:hypothetical protein